MTRLAVMLVPLTFIIALIYPTPASAQLRVYGAIGDKYQALGGERSFLGAPLTDELDAPHGGRYNRFQGGYIYWHPETGAHTVYGAIGERWQQLGNAEYGFPITDEVPTPGRRGRFNHFRAVHVPGKPERSIYWSPTTGAHEVYGAIRAAWAAQGWENGPLGFPTSGELQSGGGRVSNFEHGFIRWTPEGGTRTVLYDIYKQMITSDRNPNLAINAYGGARHGTVLRLHNGCRLANPDCTWHWSRGMLVSDRDPSLAINAWDGARHSTVLRLHNGCRPENPDCTWHWSRGMLVSDRDPSLAIKAWDGARHGTVLRLHNGCRPDNPDCTWTFRTSPPPPTTPPITEPPLPTPGTLSVGLVFDVVGTQPSQTEGLFEGRLVQGTGGPGTTTFSVRTGLQQVSPHPAQSVGVVVRNLAAGTWNVTGMALGLTGPLTCSNVVVGSGVSRILRIDISGGRGLRCG